MSAAMTMALAVEQGVILRLEGGQVRLRASSPPSPVLLASLRQYRAEIAMLLSGDVDHDAAEAEAMREYYAAPAGPDLAPDPMVPMLLRASRQRPPSWPDPASIPPPGAWCGCCSRHDQTKRGRWWVERKDPKGWRCWACHPPALTEAEVAEVRT